MTWTTSAREGQGRRWMSSTFRVAKKVSATGLSRQVPGLPMEQVMPACCSRSPAIQSHKVEMRISRSWAHGSRERSWTVSAGPAGGGTPGRRCDVRPDDRRGQINGAGISGSWQVAGSRSTPKVWVPEREQCVDGPWSLLSRPVLRVRSRLSSPWVHVHGHSDLPDARTLDLFVYVAGVCTASMAGLAVPQLLPAPA